jgi:predicted regulator of Ras-like GTPase activity (Roadblock/LC7/MglB family)
MATLPQLLQDDVQTLGAALDDLLGKSEATSALILDKGGFVIGESGDTRAVDTTTLGALAAAAYAATQGIASLVGEANFSSVYQQGENYSLLVSNIDEHCLLVVIFNAQISVGAVKYYAMGAISRIAQQLQVARSRSPDEGVDLSILNLADAGEIFSKRSEEPPAPETQNLDLQPLFTKKALSAQSVAEPAAVEAPAASGDASTGDPMVKLQKIKKLLASGLITQEDFEFKKRKILEEL